MASIHIGCTIIKCEIVCDLGQNVGLDSSGSDEYLTLLLGLKSQLVFLSAFPLVPSCWHISPFRSVSTIYLLSFLGSGGRTIRRALGDRDAGVTQAHKPSSRNFVVCRRVSIAIPKHSQTSRALATLSPTATAFSDTLDMSDTLKNWYSGPSACAPRSDNAASTSVSSWSAWHARHRKTCICLGSVTMWSHVIMLTSPKSCISFQMQVLQISLGDSNGFYYFLWSPCKNLLNSKK